MRFSALVALLAVAGGQSLAQDSVELHSVSISNGQVRVEYSKNFVTCAHLYRDSTNSITHVQNLFCPSGEHVVITEPESAFRILTVGETVRLQHGNNSGIRSASVTVTNPPAANAGADQDVECEGADTVVQLDGSGSSDPNGDNITYHWSAPSGVTLSDANSANPMGLFPFGVTMVTLTVTDEHGAMDTDDVLIAVTDNTPPEVICTTDIGSLAPANGEMVAVEIYVEATDMCASPAALQLVAVGIESNEPDDASGKSDGTTTGDTNGQDGFTSPVDVTDSFVFNPVTLSFDGTVLLRAERDKKGNGRTYSITAYVVDTQGNLAQTSCVVVVPKSGGGGGKGGNGNGGGKGKKK